MHVITFEDEHVWKLYPLTLGRPAYAVLCGSYRLVDWIEQLARAPQAIVRDYLGDIQRADFPCFRPPSERSTTETTMWVNARLVPSYSNYQALCKLRDEARPGIVRTGSAVAAAVIPANLGTPEITVESDSLSDVWQRAEAAALAVLDVDLPLLEYPHDVVRWNQRTMNENLEHRLREGAYRELQDGLFAAEGVQLGQYAVSDTSAGPIVLESHARIGPYSFLSGPVHLGSHTRVIEHAAIKDFVSIGHTAKIGGEVEASVIEDFTNKQHHGFLGHSYLGSWINLGAGTCNSDLKNTYGEVKMEYQGTRVATGMQFIGCVMGDYAKSAINTGIFTGKMIGACSMIYGFVTTNVPSFVNYARLFGQVTELPPDVMVATQARMFVRRKVTQRPCDQQLIYDMFSLTEDERQRSSDALAL